MRILIIGQGGREHALAWKLAQSKRVQRIWVAPGNAGTEQEEKVSNVAIEPMDFSALADFAQQQKVHYAIIGPEAPLAAGICDVLSAQGVACLGPSQAGAKLESSKIFAKHIMQQQNIKTPDFAVFSVLEDALQYLKTQTLPIVIKADGLASGKGVTVAKTLAQAQEACKQYLCGQAFTQHTSPSILIESFVEGIEASFMVLTDGKWAIPLATAKDHKTRDANQQGPNTGGMGACSPTSALTETMQHHALQHIIMPALQALADQGITYVGFLYAGLMITPKGDIHTLEFNCRLGDPETQVILPRLESDLAELCQAAVQGTLNHQPIRWDPRHCVGVVMASGGYPEAPITGHRITGLDQHSDPDVTVFHAGTTREQNHIITSGGRVCCVTALADDLRQAQDSAYKQVQRIHWPNHFYRTDIGDSPAQIQLKEPIEAT